jgi:hypothetical protein
MKQDFEIRADEEVSDAGSLAMAIHNVKAQIVHPVNTEHRRFMRRVLLELETRSAGQASKE